MIREYKVLSIIPARGGSKGLSLKNLRPLQGRSLVRRAIEVCQSRPWIDRILVSTDHSGIAQEAKAAGSEVPFLRPESLSGDRVGDLEVLQHGLLQAEEFWKTQYDIILMIQPTSPLRKGEDLERCVSTLVQGSFDAVWTVSEIDLKFHPLKQLVFREGKLSLYEPGGRQIIARQQLTGTYFRNGSCYAFTRDCLLNQKTILPTKSSAVVLDRPMISIDSEEDLEIAESLLSP